MSRDKFDDDDYFSYFKRALHMRPAEMDDIPTTNQFMNLSEEARTMYFVPHLVEKTIITQVVATAGSNKGNMSKSEVHLFTADTMKDVFGEAKYPVVFFPTKVKAISQAIDSSCSDSSDAGFINIDIQMRRLGKQVASSLLKETGCEYYTIGANSTTKHVIFTHSGTPLHNPLTLLYAPYTDISEESIRFWTPPLMEKVLTKGEMALLHLHTAMKSTVTQGRNSSSQISYTQESTDVVKTESENLRRIRSNFFDVSPLASKVFIGNNTNKTRIVTLIFKGYFVVT